MRTASERFGAVGGDPGSASRLSRVTSRTAGAPAPVSSRRRPGGGATSFTGGPRRSADWDGSGGGSPIPIGAFKSPATRAA